MFLVLGNMNGKWFIAAKHLVEEEAWKIAIKLTNVTGHKHIVKEKI